MAEHSLAAPAQLNSGNHDPRLPLLRCSGCAPTLAAMGGLIAVYDDHRKRTYPPPRGAANGTTPS